MARAMKNDKLIVGLDVDGVLFPFYEETLRELQAHGEPMGTPTASGWDFVKQMTPKQLEIAKALWANEQFTLGFPTLPQPLLPYEWAQPLYQSLFDCHILVITSPMSVPYWTSGRDTWLDNHFGHNKRNTVYTAQKHLVKFDLLIDDKPETVIDVFESGSCSEVILVEREYSRNDPYWEEAANLGIEVVTPDKLVEATRRVVNQLKKECDLT